MNNLLNSGYKVAAIHGFFVEKSENYPSFIERKSSPRELAESVDIIISGN